ncbi:MAG TPA: hypothetical protein VIW25_01070 [Nitrososphaeraceae archaeon]
MAGKGGGNQRLLLEQQTRGQSFHWQSGKIPTIHCTGGLKSLERSGLH